MSDTPASLKKLKVNELRDKCKEFGIDNKGTKSILIHRILSHLGIIHEEIEDSSTMEDSLNVSSQNQNVLTPNHLDKSYIEFKLTPTICVNEVELQNTSFVNSPVSGDPISHDHQITEKSKTIGVSKEVAAIDKKFVFESNKPKETNTRDENQSLEIHVQTTEIKQEQVELDFVQDDPEIFEVPEKKHKQITSTTPVSSTTASKTEIKKDSTAKPIKAQSKRVCEKEDGEEYPIKYIKDTVHLDPYINDLHFVMCDDSLLTGCNLVKNELCQFWCGVKGSHGISDGNAYYNCKYVSKIGDNLGNGKPKDISHGLRIGFSSLTESLHLGDVGFSCGYDDTGRVYANGKIVGTGKKFTLGDKITAIIHYENANAIFKFLVNDEDSGVSTSLEADGVIFYPHIYFKNVKFVLDFKTRNELILEHEPLQSLMSSLVPNYRPYTSFKDCELIIMVGIVASGKSHWVQSCIKNNLAKFYNVIGRSFLYDRWRHVAQTKRHHLSERLVSQAVSKLISLAQSRPRNYILDQTNCFPSTRKRRLESFKDAGSKKAVLVMPRLSELAARIESYKKSSQDTSSDDRTLHLEDVAELKENMVLPTLEEGFTEIVYVDCDEDTAPQSLADYKYDAVRFKELRAKELKVKENIIRLPPRKRTKEPSPIRTARRRPISSSARKFAPRKIAMLSPPTRRRPNRSISPRRTNLSTTRSAQYESNRRVSPPRPITKYKSVGKPDSKSGYSGYSRMKPSKPEINYSSSGMQSNYRVAMPSSRTYSSRDSATEQNNYRDSGYSNYDRDDVPIPRVSSGRSEQSHSYQTSRRATNIYGLGRSENTPYGGMSSNHSNNWPSQHEDRRSSQTITQSHSSYQSSPPTRSYTVPSRQNFSSTSTQRGGYGGYSTSGYNSHF